MRSLRYKCLLVDGDIFRNKTKQKSFDRENILKNNIKIINYCKSKKNYDYIIVSVISPLKKTRQIAFREFKNDYFEIFVFCSIKNLIGFNSKIKYEKSNHRHIRINTHLNDKKKCMKKISKFTFFLNLKNCF